MSSVQSLQAERPAGGPPRKDAPDGAEFAAIFAHIASRATLHTGAAGRLSLTLTAAGAGPGPGAEAAQSWSAEPTDAAQEDASRDEPHRSEGRGRDADRAESRARAGRAEAPGGGVRSWSAVAQGQQSNSPGAPGAHAPEGPRGDPQPQAPKSAVTEAACSAPAGATPGVPQRPAATPGAPAARSATAIAGISGVSAPGGTAPGLLAPGAGSPSPRPNLAMPGGERSAPAPPHPREEVAFRAQLTQGLASALRRGEGEVTLRLRPEFLGEVRVHLSVRGSTVDAHIRPTTSQAHRLLEQSLDTLRAALESRGLHIGRLEIEPGAQEARTETMAAEPQQQSAWREGGRDQGDAPRESAPERDVRGGAADSSKGPQDDGPTEARAPGSMEHPGVVYGVADGAARILMIDALA